MQRSTTNRTIATVLVAGVDGHGLGLIRECLSTEAAIPNENLGYAETVEAVRRHRAQVVIVGFDADFDAAIRLGSTLKAENPNLVLFAHASAADPERIRAAMRSGYQDFVVLPEDTDLLRRAVREAPRETLTATDQGHVVAVIGAKGGCGSTFVSVNLAAELAPVHRVCVVDMDFSMGDVASFLDLQPSSTLHDLLANLNRLDERMVAGSVSVHPSQLHVIAQPLELVETEFLRSEDLVRVLTAAADAYHYLVVDCGGRLDDATRTAITVADQVILLCTPDVPSVKNAWRRLHLLERQGVDLHSVRLVVNKWSSNAPLTQLDIESNLGIPVAATIANDPQRCQHAINIGALLRDVDKRSPAGRDLSNMVPLITEGVARVDPVKSDSPLSWLFK
jgi:pilus assembly protein CpaE